MKKNYFKVLFASLFISILFVGISSCSTSTQDYLDEYEIRRMIQEELKKNNESLEFTQWKIVNFEVKKEEWVWNENAAQWEAIKNLPDLTEFIYEDGANIGYIFIGEQGKDEVQKILPYSNTYSGTDDAGNVVTFTETISYDVQLGNPSTVAFFIKDSWLAKDGDAPQNYFFRIVLIW